MTQIYKFTYLAIDSLLHDVIHRHGMLRTSGDRVIGRHGSSCCAGIVGDSDWCIGAQQNFVRGLLVESVHDRFSRQ